MGAPYLGHRGIGTRGRFHWVRPAWGVGGAWGRFSLLISWQVQGLLEDS